MTWLKRLGLVGWCGLVTILVTACGGSGDSTTPGGSTATSNTLAVIVDDGPTASTPGGTLATNTLYTSVTVCTPGSTSACQTIDHIQVDTGSTGLRILSSVLNGTAKPAPLADAGTGSPLRECTQFADGYVWGSVATVDVELGGRTIAALPIQVIGDPAAGAAPSDCVSGPVEDTVAQFGANGLLGIGNFLQDCGPACAIRVEPATYYVCPNGSCTGVALALDLQVQNPISMLKADNNGVLIKLPKVAAPGATTVVGTLYFGIATQSNNQLGSADLYTMDDTGSLSTTFEGAALADSYLDTGSNGYFFNTNNIPVCADYTDFFCPTSGTGSGSVAESATIQGVNGALGPVDFTVDNTDSLFALPYSAYPDLAGPSGAVNGLSIGFDWGLPFFFGRSVYVLFEQQSVNGATGPAVGF